MTIGRRRVLLRLTGGALAIGGLEVIVGVPGGNAGPIAGSGAAAVCVAGAAVALGAALWYVRPSRMGHLLSALAAASLAATIHGAWTAAAPEPSLSLDGLALASALAAVVHVIAACLPSTRAWDEVRVPPVFLLGRS
ncbi:MAG: hypothetical protein AB7O28_25615 [Vicinamibacterales bacterium]